MEINRKREIQCIHHPSLIIQNYFYIHYECPNSLTTEETIDCKYFLINGEHLKNIKSKETIFITLRTKGQ